MNIHIEKAVSLFDGSQTKLAEAMNKSPVLLGRKKKISQGHIWQWLHEYEGKRPCAENAIAIEQATNKQVTRLDIRPDIFSH